MNRSYELNLKLWGLLIGLAVFAVLSGALTAIETVGRVRDGRAQSLSQSRALSELERAAALNRAQLEAKADGQQAAIDNNVNLYSSVTLTDYICDPATPPRVDSAIFAKPDERVMVADSNQRTIGYIEETFYGGGFIFQPERCQN